MVYLSGKDRWLILLDTFHFELEAADYVVGFLAEHVSAEALGGGLLGDDRLALRAEDH